MAGLRHAWGGWAGRVGLPATAGMAGLGAWAMRSDPELLLKSRRVVPGRLRDAGFSFAHPDLDTGPPRTSSPVGDDG